MQHHEKINHIQDYIQNQKGFVQFVGLLILLIILFTVAIIIISGETTMRFIAGLIAYPFLYWKTILTTVGILIALIILLAIFSRR